MPPDQPPQNPKIPEYEKPSPRAILIALLSWYLFEMEDERKKETEAHKVFLQAPIKPTQEKIAFNRPNYVFGNGHGMVNLVPEGYADYHTSKMMYQSLRVILDMDIESQGSQVPFEDTWMFQRMRSELEDRFIKSLYKDGKVQKDADAIENQVELAAIVEMYVESIKNEYKSFKNYGVAPIFKKATKEFTDTGFINRFGYNAVIRGMNDEILALLPAPNDSGNPPLFLGMTVSYTKHLEPSGQTGPLAGTGRITAFLIPSRENDIIPDQVIQLDVHAEEGVVTTLLSPNEVSVG